LITQNTHRGASATVHFSGGVREEPEQDGEGDADDQAGDNRKVEGGVLAAMNDIAGQAAKAERQARSEVQRSSNNNANRAKDQKGPSKFAERVHSLEADAFLSQSVQTIASN
jgi:hypothetical protein